MNDRKLITTNVFLNFLFRRTGSYQSYIGTVRKNEEHRTPFYFLVVFIVLFTVQREKKEVPILNKILLWSSHIFRTYRLFYLVFRNFDLCYALLTPFISWLKGSKSVGYPFSKSEEIIDWAVDRWSKEFYDNFFGMLKKDYFLFFY